MVHRRTFLWLFWLGTLSRNGHAADSTMWLASCYSDVITGDGFFASVPFFAKLALEEGLFDDQLQGHTWTVNISATETKCRSVVASAAALPMLLGFERVEPGRDFWLSERRPPPVGIVGCLCSGETMAVAGIAAPRGIPVISGASTSPLLSDKFTYPTFLRTVPPDSGQGRAIAHLVLSFGWHRLVAFVELGSVWATGILDTVKKEAADLGTADILTYQVPDGFEDALEVMKLVTGVRPTPRVFLLIAVAKSSFFLKFQAAIDAGLVMPQSAWLFTAEHCIVGRDIPVESRVSSTAMARYPEALQGVICPMPEAKGPLRRSAKWLKFIAGMTGDKLARAGFPPSITYQPYFALDTSWDIDYSFPLHFDAAISFFFAFQQLVDNGLAPNNITGPALHSALKDLSFDGLSGKVAFDENGDRLAPYSVKNFQIISGSMTLEVVGHFEGATDTFTLNRPVQFADGGSVAPADRPAPCAAGREYDVSSDGCSACSAGRYARFADSICIPCDTGTATNLTGQVSCALCLEGTAASTTGLTSCMPCSVGQYARYNGCSSCSNCSAGFYSQAAGASSCAACPLGTYSEEDGASQCTSCSSPGSAMQLFAGLARTLTTRYLGASTAEACACPDGFYRDERERDTCKYCPAGMSCDFGSDWKNVGTEYGPRPVAKEGFMTTASRPHEVYKCLPAGCCPGGPPGSCAPYRDGAAVACGNCEQGAYPTGTSCTKCDTRVGAIPVILTVVLVVLTLAIVVYSVNKDLILQTHGSINIVVGVGLIAALLQILGLFGNLSVRWPTLTDSVLNALKFLNFDLGILRLSCVVHRGPVLSFLYPQLLAPFAAFVIGIVLYFKKMRRPSTRFAAEFGNSLGTVLNTFFVGVLLSTMKPFLCYDHPSGESSSLINQPSVLCNYASEHRSMVVIGMMSCILVPLPFTSIVLYSTLKYKTLIVQQADSIMLLSTRWLFFKYEPSRYFYGSVLLTKSILVCLVPVVIRDRAKWQVLMLTAVLVLFGKVQTGLWPWRSTPSNFIDALTSLFLILLLQCADSGNEDDGLNFALQALALLFIVSLLVVGLLSFAFNVVQIILVRPFYKWFICHHKAHAGAQARFMKMLLDSKSPNQGDGTFLDSDHLKDLDRLFDLVKSRTGCLVVYLTSDTLRRLWCCGEISTACSLNVKVVRVVTDKFMAPTQEQLQNIYRYVDFSGGTLDKYGIDANAIEMSLTWIIGDVVPEVTMQKGVIGEYRLTHLVDGLLAQTRLSTRVGTSLKRLRASTLSTSTSLKPLQPSMRSSTASPSLVTVVFSADPFDDEAIAAAGIVRLSISSDLFNKFGSAVQCLHDHDSENIVESYGQIILASSACVVFMASGTLACWEQLYTIFQAIDTLPDGAVLPATLPDFRFPAEIFYLQNSLNVITGDPLVIRERFRTFFRLIAVPVSTSASRQILSTQACEVCTRLASVLNVKVGQRTSKPARKLTSCEQVRPVKPSPQVQVANTVDDVEVDDDDDNVTVYRANDVSQAANAVADGAVCNLDAMSVM